MGIVGPPSDFGDARAGWRKPVLTAIAPGLNQVTSAMSFDQWYRDVPGVNERFDLQFPLVNIGGDTWSYEDTSFFPIDDMGLPRSG